MNTNKFICHGCVAEPYLQRQIRNLGVESECSYCLARAPAYSLGQMADRMETAFEQHYQCTPPTRDTFSHPYLRPRAGTRALNAIADAAGLPALPGRTSESCLRRAATTTTPFGPTERRSVLRRRITHASPSTRRDTGNSGLRSRTRSRPGPRSRPTPGKHSTASSATSRSCQPTMQVRRLTEWTWVP